MSPEEKAIEDLLSKLDYTLLRLLIEKSPEPWIANQPGGIPTKSEVEMHCRRILRDAVVKGDCESRGFTAKKKEVISNRIEDKGKCILTLKYGYETTQEYDSKEY